MKVLITGGAGFIGSHLADELIREGHEVRILDSLDAQVHGPQTAAPGYLNPDAELIPRDVRDSSALQRALKGCDAVVHLAAAVGVGQSMYEVEKYVSVNTLGTARLLEALGDSSVKRLVVASSMSIYGEGLYEDADGQEVAWAERRPEDIRAGVWEPRDADRRTLTPLPTPERKPPKLTSVYALSKYDQERMCLMIGQARGLPTTALRFFNVYGPRQALSNPYTGVLAIFAARYLNDRPPLIFEDGEQKRDFVSVHDVARACRLALESDDADGRVFNIGSGEPQTINQVAGRMAAALDKTHIEPQINGRYRVGDVRHCFADISLARRSLGFEPAVRFEDGLAELAEWLREQSAEDRTETAHAELAARGLTV